MKAQIYKVTRILGHINATEDKHEAMALKVQNVNDPEDKGWCIMDSCNAADAETIDIIHQAAKEDGMEDTTFEGITFGNAFIFADDTDLMDEPSS